MLRRTLTAVGWGAAGIALSAGLVVGAFAIAGARLTEPAVPIRVSTPPLVADATSTGDADRPAASRSPEPTATRSPEDRAPSPTATSSPDDHGGNSGPGGGSGGEPGDD